MLSGLQISKDKYGKTGLIVSIYYLILLIGYVVLSRPEADYSNNLRILYFLAILVPTFRDTSVFTFAIVCFYSMTYIAFTPILPTSVWYYLPIVFLYLIANRKQTYRLGQPLLIWLYFVFTSLFFADFQVFLPCFLIAIIISSFIRNSTHLESVAIALMISSLILSILFYTNMEAFAYAYGSGHDTQRFGWINPNEYAGAIGCGAVIAVQSLFGKTQQNSILMKALCGITILFSTVVIILNASRGAAISYCLVLSLFLLTSKLNKKAKVFSVFFVVTLFIYIVRSNISELLISRLNESTLATGTGRFDIWEAKWNSFITDGNILELIFGIGREACFNIPPVISTHNDFLTAFIGYGFIGFILFVTMMLYPLFLVRKEYKVIVALLTLYIIMECCVLEPLFRGYFTFIIYYFYIYRFAIIHKKAGK